MVSLNRLLCSPMPSAPIRRVLTILFLLPAVFGAALPSLAADDPAPGDKPPATIESRLEAASGTDDHPGFDHLIVFDETVNRVDDRGVTETESQVVYKVLTPAGCIERSALRWGYDPQSSWVDVRSVELVRDGERIAVPVENVLDLPAPQAAIYWSDRVKQLQLPRLHVGDGIVVNIFRKGFTYALLDGGESGAGGEPEDERFIPPMPGEYFDIVIFQADVPTLEKRYELRLPADKRLHSRVYNGALYSSTSYTDDESVYTWWGLDISPTAHEPRQAGGSDYLIKVVIATVESWEKKSRWFFGVNDRQFDSNPEIDEAVGRILEDAGVSDGTDDQKAEVLVHWVAQNIRYSGQTMGKGEGFTLHPGDMIFEQRSGVCKDIAGMLITMMRAAGIPTFGAMTMAGSRIEEVPADQFNHCVVARKTGDGFVMYDPTWVPFNNDIWSKLETEQHYLIGTPEGEPLQQIAYSPPEESPLRVRHQATLTADGMLEGMLRFDGSGAMDGRLRRIVYNTPIDRMDERFARLLAPACPAVEGVQVRHRATDDFSGDMWVEVDYRAPGFALLVTGGLEFTSPAMAALLRDGTLFRGGAQKWAETRETDVFLYYTQLLDVVETIRVPGGFTAVDLPESEEVDETFGYFKGNAEMKDGSLVIRSRAEVRRRQIPPDGYGGFAKAIGEARKWGEALIHLEGEETGE